MTKIYLITCLLVAVNYLSGQTVKLETFNIDYPPNEKLSDIVFIPIESFSIDGKDDLEQSKFYFDYLDATKNQIKSLAGALFSHARFEDYLIGSLDSNSYTLSVSVQGTSLGSIQTAFSNYTTKVEMTWKFVSNSSNEIIFREKVEGEFTNNIGNMLSYKPNAKKRIEQALMAAFLNSYELLYGKITEYLENK